MAVEPITASGSRLYGTYSFLDVSCTISGPGGSFPIGAGSANSEEGITVEPTADQATMTIGADGSGMYSLHSDRSGRFLVRLLKISPTNALLMAKFEFERSSAAFFGQSILVITDYARGDNIIGRGVSVIRAPTIGYNREGPPVEWTFGAIVIDRLLGSGVLNVAF